MGLCCLIEFWILMKEEIGTLCVLSSGLVDINLFLSWLDWALPLMKSRVELQRDLKGPCPLPPIFLKSSTLGLTVLKCALNFTHCPLSPKCLTSHGFHLTPANYPFTKKIYFPIFGRYLFHDTSLYIYFDRSLSYQSSEVSWQSILLCIFVFPKNLRRNCLDIFCYGFNVW